MTLDLKAGKETFVKHHFLSEQSITKSVKLTPENTEDLIEAKPFHFTLVFCLRKKTSRITFRKVDVLFSIS